MKRFRVKIDGYLMAENLEEALLQIGYHFIGQVVDPEHQLREVFTPQTDIEIHGSGDQTTR